MTKRRQTIDLRHLRYFLAAAEHGSFRKAGVLLAVQESAISRRIRDLEDCLGASLFQRHNGGVRLTLAGHRFLDRARAAMCNIEAAAYDVAAIGRVETGRIRIGTAPGAVSAFFMELLRSYDQAHAGVHIDFIEGDVADQLTAIRRREIDVALVAGSGAWDGCEAMPLWSEPICVVLPEGHHLVGHTDLTWQHLSGECFIGESTLRDGTAVNQADAQFAGVARSSMSGWFGCRHHEHLPLVALGRGVLLTCAAGINPAFPGIVYRPIVGEALAFGAVWLPSNDNPALRRLLATARSQLQRTER